jgi:hypothetical protein
MSYITHKHGNLVFRDNGDYIVLINGTFVKYQNYIRISPPLTITLQEEWSVVTKEPYETSSGKIEFQISVLEKALLRYLSVIDNLLWEQSVAYFEGDCRQSFKAMFSPFIEDQEVLRLRLNANRHNQVTANIVFEDGDPAPWLALEDDTRVKPTIMCYGISRYYDENAKQWLVGYHMLCTRLCIDKNTAKKDYD